MPFKMIHPQKIDSAKPRRIRISLTVEIRVLGYNVLRCIEVAVLVDAAQVCHLRTF